MDSTGSWLSARHSLSNLENKILKQRQNDIFDVFGGFRGLLNALLRSQNNLNRNEFHLLINIFTRDDDDNDIESKTNIIIKTTSQISYKITSLSYNALSYICTFLDFKSLTQFELTCADIAMICHKPESVYDFQSPLDDISSPRFFQRLDNVVQANKCYDFHRFSLIKLYSLDFYNIFDPNGDHGSDSTNGQMENIKYYTKYFIPMIAASVIDLNVSGRYNPKVTPIFPNVTTVTSVSDRMQIKDITEYAPNVRSINLSHMGLGLPHLCTLMFDEAFKNVNCLKLWYTSIGMEAYSFNGNNQVGIRNIIENKDDFKTDIDQYVADKDKLETLFLATPMFGASNNTFIYPWILILHSNSLQSLHVSLNVFYCEIPDFQSNNACFMIQSVFEKTIKHKMQDTQKIYNFPKLKELFLKIDKISSGRNNPMEIIAPNIERLKITFERMGSEEEDWNLNRSTKCLYDLSPLQFLEIKYNLRAENTQKIIKFTKTINSFLRRCIREKKQKNVFNNDLYILLNAHNLTNWDKEHNHTTNASWIYLLDVFKTIQTEEKFKIRFKLIIKCSDNRYKNDFKRITEQITSWTKSDNKSNKDMNNKWTISYYAREANSHRASYLYYCKYQWNDYCIANWIHEH